MCTYRLACLLLLLPLLAACEANNDHFCARYRYVYNQLLEEGVPSYGEMRPQLIASLSDPKKDKEQAKFMLFVLEDWYSEIKPVDESAEDFCMRIKRWQHYQ